MGPSRALEIVLSWLGAFCVWKDAAFFRRFSAGGSGGAIRLCLFGAAKAVPQTQGFRLVGIEMEEK